MMNFFTLRALGCGLAVAGALGLAAQSRMDTRSKADRPNVAGAALRRAPQAQLKHNNSNGLVSRGGGYCAASASGSIDFDLDERIVNVAFSNINNATANAAPIAPAYTLYPTPAGNVTAGMTYTLSVNVNTTTLTTGFSESQVLAWIDYNQDFDFGDAGEQVLISAIGALDIYSGDVTIPLGATLGTTRMRIRLHDTHDGTDYINVFNDTPCGDASYGEIEDYVLNITAGGGGAPSNDLCANAALIGVNSICVTTAGTTENATQSVAPAACSGFTATSANDVWFTFTATTASTTIEVTGAGDATTGMDPVLEAFSGTCATLTSLGCIDATLRGGTESLTITTTPGTSYFYRVYYWPYVPQTVFGYTTCVISVGAGSAPPNDLCTNASVIGVNATCVSTPGTTENATQSLAPAACSGFTATSANDVWYTFTATAASTTIEVTGAGDATTGMDPVLEAFSGSCIALTSLGCIDATLRGGTETLTITTTPGTTYLYRVYYWPYVPQTVFGFTTCVIAGGGGGTPPNDDCTGAVAANIAVPGSNTFSGDNTGATEDGTTGFVIVWEAFTIAACANVDINYCVPGSEFDDFLVNLSVGCPDFLTGILTGTVSVDNCTLSFAELAAGTYYIPVLVDPVNTPVGAYSIEVITTACGGGGTPPNDLCTAVTPVGLSVPGSVDFSGDNTGATDTEELGFGNVWHSFTTTECANITLSYCATTPAFENSFLNLFIGCPFTDFVEAASFETTSCGNDNVTIQYTNVPAGTYYYPVLTDVGSVGPYTINVAAAPCAPPSDYCEASANSLQFEKISNVTFAGINNNSVSNAGYEDFTLGTAASVVAGQSYPLSVTTAGGFATDQVLAWVDWDHNSVFDAGEIIFSSAPGIGPFNGNVTVPLTAAAGPTRMRVRLHDTYVGANYPNTPNPTPCDTSTYGQVEDYTVDMIGIITGASGLSEAEFGVYPNPTDGNMIVRTGNLHGSVLIEVMDALGRVAFAEQRTVAKSSSMPISLAGILAKGTYLVRMSTTDAREEQRIVIR
ncbi:MAG: T9SS type A sorting domain-containing protein [Flavobacteriales bacterium]|nr:T9SS type A sorting domain-containing protein [Flavobacteriales bacterium]